MAAVLDFVSESSRFHHSHKMIAGSGQQRSPAEPQYRQRSRSRTDRPSSPRPQHTPAAAGTPPPRTSTRAVYHEPPEDASEKNASVKAEPPSPPSSSSPNPGSYSRQRFTSQEN